MVVAALLAGVQLASASPRSLRSLEARVEALADQLQTLEKEAQAHTELAETFIQGDVDHDTSRARELMAIMRVSHYVTICDA